MKGLKQESREGLEESKPLSLKTFSGPQCSERIPTERADFY